MTDKLQSTGNALTATVTYSIMGLTNYIEFYEYSESRYSMGMIDDSKVAA